MLVVKVVEVVTVVKVLVVVVVVVVTTEMKNDAIPRNVLGNYE